MEVSKCAKPTVYLSSPREADVPQVPRVAHKSPQKIGFKAMCSHKKPRRHDGANSSEKPTGNLAICSDERLTDIAQMCKRKMCLKMPTDLFGFGSGIASDNALR